jgi:hypothetical protein
MGAGGLAALRRCLKRETTMDDDKPILIESRNQFHDALRRAFADAATTGCREILLCDDDFADWPLSERRVIEDLTRWASSHRSLTVIARHFDEMPRRHARWTEWRRTWSHIVHCRANNELEAGQMPVMLLAPGATSVRLVDPVRYRGSVTRDKADTVVWREAIDAVLQRSEESFPPTLLGL